MPEENGLSKSLNRLIKHKSSSERDCCDFGEHAHTVPMPIRGRVQYIDECVADIVAALNAANIVTDASCCGHGKINPVISLEDGRHLVIMDKEGLDKFLDRKEY